MLPSRYVCQSDPAPFFSDDPSEIAEAKTACRSCPNMLPCRALGIDNAEPFGVFGGLSAEDRGTAYVPETRDEAREARRTALLALVAAEPSLGVRELARRTGMGPSTVLYVLTTQSALVA